MIRKTSAQKLPTRTTAPEQIAKNESGARFIAKIVRELLQAERFTDPCALREAIEARCRVLQVSCSRNQIERAFDLVASNRPLLQDIAPVSQPVTPDPGPVNHRDAAALLDYFGIDVSGGRLRPKSSAPQPSSRLVRL